MQVISGMVPLAIVLQFLVLQTIWLIVGRISRDRYLRDIMSFRTPSSSLSRYYSWRIEHASNAILEGFIVLFILVVSILGFGMTMFTIDLVLASSTILLIVMSVSFISALQHAWRVKEIVETEARIVTSIKTSKDKIGVAKRMIDDLYNQGTLGDGRTWFALFKIAQKRDEIGWAIKDVLIEKGKEEDSRLQRTEKQPESSSGSKGPEID